jgi:hypothetical protein
MLAAESWSCTGLPCCGGRGASSVPGRQATCELQVNQRRSGNRPWRNALHLPSLVPGPRQGEGIATCHLPPAVLVFWAYHPAPPTINLKNLTAGKEEKNDGSRLSFGLGSPCIDLADSSFMRLSSRRHSYVLCSQVADASVSISLRGGHIVGVL